MPRRSPRKHNQGDARLSSDSLREPGSAGNNVDSRVGPEHAHLRGEALLLYLRSSPLNMTREQLRSVMIPFMCEELYGGDDRETISTDQVSGFREIFLL